MAFNASETTGEFQFDCIRQREPRVRSGGINEFSAVSGLAAPQRGARPSKRGVVRLLLLFGLASIFSPRGSSQGVVSDPKLLHRTFDTVWSTVNSRYYDPTFGGVDWNAVKAKYEAQVDAVKTDIEFRDLLGRMLGEIKISHLSIIDLEHFDRLVARAEVTRGLALRDLDGQVVVTRVVEGSSAATAGLSPGFIVKAIDGMPLANARDAEKTLATDTVNHRLTVVDEANAARELDVEHKLPPKDKLESTPPLGGFRYAFVETKVLKDTVGYIHFTNFIEPMVNRLRPVFTSMKDTTGIIIDLRGNSGGDTETGLALAGMFVDKETPISTTKTRRGTGQRYTAKPQKNPYLGKVVILIDEASASESEDLTAGLQAMGRVRVIGRTSRGENMDATVQELPMKSIALLYPIGLPQTPKGTVIEGRGVVPDVEVRLTRAELLQGKDSQLEAAIQYLTSPSQ